MSVQTSYRLYQNDKGIGIIGENNPYDIGAYLAGVNGIPWGTFVARAALGTRDITLLKSKTDFIIGATTKQEDRVDGLYGGINPDTTSNDNLQFTISKGRPASVMRMGYLNMHCASNTWQEGGGVYVKLTSAVTADTNPTGTIAGTAINADYVLFEYAIFADSSTNTQVLNVAKVFFDVRIPRQAKQAITK